MAPLSHDAQRLREELARLPLLGGAGHLNWSPDRLALAAEELVAAGHAEYHLDGVAPPSLVLARAVDDAPARRRERDLYAPLQRWLQGHWGERHASCDGEELFERNYVLDVTISAERRSGARRWEVPDLMSVTYRRYRYVPGISVELTSF